MTTVRKLKIAAGAGDPDPVLALRIDVVKAAEELADVLTVMQPQMGAIASRQLSLVKAVDRYRQACARRRA